MMLSKAEAVKKIGEDATNEKLLNEIETLSKALYRDRNPSSLRSSTSTPSKRAISTGKTQLIDSKGKLKYDNDDLSRKDKKSIWNWKPLKAFSRSRKFNCCFSVQVHSIEGLPPSFDNVSLHVHWKRRDGEMVTNPVKVSKGIAEFEDKLMHICVVHGSRSGPHHSARYDAKHFLLYASVVSREELDLGKHRVDLTRLLPVTLEELEEEKSLGTWTTSFKLSGEAKGAVMNVSFGYTVVRDSLIPPGNGQNLSRLSSLKQKNERTVKPSPRSGPGDGKSAIHRARSLPGTSNQQLLDSSGSVDRVKDLHEVLPVSRLEVAVLENMPHGKSHEEKLDASVDCEFDVDVCTRHLELIKPDSFPESEFSQKSVDDVCKSSESPSGEWKELSTNATEVNTDGNIQVAVKEGTKICPEDMGNGSNSNGLVVYDIKKDDLCSKDALMKELESALNNVSNLEAEVSDSPEENDYCMDVKTDDQASSKESLPSLDDLTESVASEFLQMLDIEHCPSGFTPESEPDSPRERLLRQFEKDSMASGYSLFDFDVWNEDQEECGYDALPKSGWGDLPKDFELLLLSQVAEEDQMGTQAMNGKMSAKMLEGLETEALMREWGLNDAAFQCSPPKNSSGFESPADLPPEEPLELPPLGEGLGPLLQTKNGEFLRSMSPSLFRKSKLGGSLIMQVSNPVVVPAEMGSGINDILQQLASVGIEKLSMEANKLMPLEDITGKTMQQVAWEASFALEGPESQSLSPHKLEIGEDMSAWKESMKERSSAPRSSKFSSSSVGNETGSECASIEYLAPLAMDKIEALSIEGLRIQSGMSDGDAFTNISSKSIGEVSALQGKDVNISGSLSLEGAAGLQLLDIKDSDDDIDGLMSLSLSLDEWMRLDSGDIGDEDQISERTSRILAAHHASSLESIRGGSKGERRRGKGSGKRCGLLGNNFTVALMVQLRDPLRNYEPVGTPMLALIQVERVFVPPKPKIYCKVSEVRSNNEDDELESMAKEETQEEKALEEEEIPQFRISEVQIAGLKTEPGKKKLWGTTTQQQSGSRWLLANGMGKINKHAPVRSKAVSNNSSASLTTKVPSGNSLWSSKWRK